MYRVGTKLRPSAGTSHVQHRTNCGERPWRAKAQHPRVSQQHLVCKMQQHSPISMDRQALALMYEKVSESQQGSGTNPTRLHEKSRKYLTVEYFSMNMMHHRLGHSTDEKHSRELCFQMLSDQLKTSRKGWMLWRSSRPSFHD